MNEIPTAEDIAHILAETPRTLFLTVSRGATAWLNELAVQAIFGEEAVPLAVVPADPESNVQNYSEGKMVAEEPLEVTLYLNARVILTKNLNKAIGFVNGMGAVVLGLQNGNSSCALTKVCVWRSTPGPQRTAWPTTRCDSGIQARCTKCKAPLCRT